MDYCTILDGRFLPRVLALASSLHRHDPRMRLFALCADDEAENALTTLSLPGIQTLRLADLEAKYPALKDAKASRSAYEYLMTCKPWLLRYLLETHPKDIPVLSYLDGDLYFFSDPAVILKELDGGSVLLTPHRFPASWTKGLDHGIYNAGFLSLRNDDDGQKAAVYWAKKTLAWCKDIVADGKFIDQKYLDAFPKELGGVKIAQHPGLNLAPWNLRTHVVDRERGLHVDGAQLVFYHFHGLRRLHTHLVDLGIATYRAEGTAAIIGGIYKPYLHALRSATKTLRSMGVGVPALRTVREGQHREKITPGLLFSRLRRGQWIVA